MTPRSAALTGGLWPLIAVVTAATALWMIVAGLTLAWPSALAAVAACFALEGTALVCGRRSKPHLAATLSGLAQFLAFSGVALVLSYAAAATAGPLWDATFLGWDRALGLDWQAYLAFVDARPWLGRIDTVAYLSLIPQLVAAVVVLALVGRFGALRRFLLAFMATTLATILISGLMPAMAMYTALHLRPEDFPHLHPAAAYVHVAAMDGLRDGTLKVLALPQLEGIITFPSLHAAAAVLLAAAFWPIRPLRWPALVLNALLIGAAPIDGGHYFCDVLAGCALAVCALVLVGLRPKRTPSAEATLADRSVNPGFVRRVFASARR